VSNPIVQTHPQDEDDFQRELALILRANEWTAVREYPPDDANRRVDILADHDEYGKIGIETKFLTTARDGARLAEAHMQIARDYSTRTYNGESVLLWAVAPYYHGTALPGPVDDHRIQEFIRSFFHRQGIGVVDPHAETLKITFANGTIPIAGPYSQTHAARLEVDALRESVRQKQNERV
jgi:hypothetical protein